MAQASTDVWTGNVAAQGSWNSNPRSATLGQDGYVESLGVGLGYTLNSPRSQVEFAAQGLGLLHQGTGRTDRFNYTGMLNVSRQATPRLALQFSEAVVSTYSQHSPFLAADGLVYGLVLYRTNHLSGGMTYRLTPRTNLSVTARHDWVRFDSSANLVGGWQFTTGASLGRQMTAVDSLSLSYSFRHSRYQSGSRRNTDTHTLMTGWTRRLSERFALSASAGASQVNFVGFNSRYGLVAKAALSAQLRTGSVSLRYEHGTSQAYGFGRDRLFDVVGLAHSRSLGRRLSATVSGVYGRSRDLFDPTWGYDTQNYSLGLQYAAGRQWTLGAGYGWIYRDYVSVVPRSSHIVNASCSYGWQWR